MLLLKLTACVRIASALALGSSLCATPDSDLRAEGRLDPAFIQETVDSLAAVVDREYFDPEAAARVSASLRSWSQEGRYAGLQTPQTLAEALTRDLFATTHDKHLAVAVVPDIATGKNDSVDDPRCFEPGQAPPAGVPRGLRAPGVGEGAALSGAWYHNGTTNRLVFSLSL